MPLVTLNGTTIETSTRWTPRMEDAFRLLWNAYFDNEWGDTVEDQDVDYLTQILRRELEFKISRKEVEGWPVWVVGWCTDNDIPFDNFRDKYSPEIPLPNDYFTHDAHRILTYDLQSVPQGKDLRYDYIDKMLVDGLIYKHRTFWNNSKDRYRLTVKGAGLAYRVFGPHFGYTERQKVKKSKDRREAAKERYSKAVLDRANSLANNINGVTDPFVDVGSVYDFVIGFEDLAATFTIMSAVREILPEEDVSQYVHILSRKLFSDVSYGTVGRVMWYVEFDENENIAMHTWNTWNRHAVKIVRDYEFDYGSEDDRRVYYKVDVDSMQPQIVDNIEEFSKAVKTAKAIVSILNNSQEYLFK